MSRIESYPALLGATIRARGATAATAKVFITGNSQAVRLPKAFRLNTSEVWISRNEVTGEIILKPKDDDQRRRNLEELFRLIEEAPLPRDFLSEATRRNDPPRDPFEALIVVTHNTRHFERIAGLRLEDWTI